MSIKKIFTSQGANDYTGSVWILILLILALALLTGKNQRLASAWKGLTGEQTI